MKVVKKIAKILGWIITGIIMLLILALLAIQLPVVKKQIVKVAASQVNNILNAELSAGKLSGNFFTHLQLDDVLLKSVDNDTIAYISSLQLNYKLLPLINSKIVVDKIVIDDPYVYLKQLNDSTWNVMDIVKPSDDQDTTSSGFNMTVQLQQLMLNNGRVKVDSPNEQIPGLIRELYIDINGSYAENEQKVDLKEFRFITEHPDITVKNILLQANASNDQVTVSSLSLQTAENTITANGEYVFSATGKSHLLLETAPLILSEFEYYLPKDFQLQAKPALTLKGDLQNDQLALTLQLKDKEQGLDLQFDSWHLIEYLSDTTTIVSYDLALNVDKVDLRYWLNDPSLQYIIDGNLKAKGEGFDPNTMKSDITGNFGNIMLYGYPVNKLDLAVNYDAGDVSGTIDGNGSFGTLHISPRIKQLMSNNPGYYVNLNTSRLNLAPILGNKTYESDINLTASVSGSGFDLDKINAQSKLTLTPSHIMGITIDTVVSQIDLIRQNVLVHSFYVKTLSTQINAAGNYDMKGESDLRVNAEVLNASEIMALAGLTGLQTKANLSAHVTGNPSDMKADVFLGLGKTIYEDVASLDTLKANAFVNIRDNQINATGNVLANNVAASGIALDSISLKLNTDTKNYDIDLNAGSRDIQARLKTMVDLGDDIQIALSDLWLGYKGYNWKKQGDTTHILIGENEYEISGLQLASAGNDSLQTIYAGGKISRNADQDFKLDVNNLNLKELFDLFGIEQEVTGAVHMNAQLAGTAVNPQLGGNINVNDLSLQDYKFTTFEGDLGLMDSEFNMNINIIPQDSGKLVASAHLPMVVRLDSMTFNVVPRQTDSIYAQLLIDKIPLSILNIVFPVDEAKGVIQSNIDLKGTMGNPELNGGLRITDGKILYKLYGIDYRTIEAALNFDSEQIKVDTFLIRSRTGNMQANGNVEFQSQFYKGELNTSELIVRFNRFNPVDHKYYNMQMSGNVDLSANKDSVLFAGNIDIPEAEVYLPAVLNLLGQTTSSDLPKPLLLQELEKDSITSDSVVYSFRPDTAKSASKLEFLNNLQGSLKVKIPRNTWIKNDEMRLELSGDVELMKHKEYFELFGTIDVVRGQYSLLGKVFVIQSGTVTFQGGEEINPLLNIEALYSFRDGERNKKDLTLNVTGEAYSPELKFSFEGAEISEGDALSYILFGKTMDELTSSGTGGDVSASSVAETVAASLISSQLTRLLGNTLNVDYIEVKSSSSFDNASVVVGKYITNKLFVSYEQQIGQIQDTDVARYEMTMEYELFKFLFLQLTSSSLSNGFDVIFKFNSKNK